jgi:hypothetical protein
MKIPNLKESMLLVVVGIGWAFVVMAVVNFPDKTLLYGFMSLCIFCSTIPLSTLLFKEKDAHREVYDGK